MPQLPLGFAARGAEKKDEETPARRVFSVAEIQNHLRRVIEARYDRVCVRGELSTFRVPGSGHAYFGLKDRRASLRCVMWRDQLDTLRFRPQVGREVFATGRLTVYEKSGDLQLVVETLEPAGIGALHEAYEQCVQKLRDEGLTADERKKPLPRYPRRIGVVTSMSGAALRDVVRTILRRNHTAHVIISDARVQGSGAAFQIVSAIRRLDENDLADVIIVCRGGGSLEDLWAFNEEPVARAIAAARTPIITGIGHETDTTIADLVADFRASTPTAAAEHVSAIARETRDRITRIEARLSRNMSARTTRLSRDLHALSKRLRDPTLAIQKRAQQIDDLSVRAERSIRERLRQETIAVGRIERRLAESAPSARMARSRHQLELLTARLDAAAQQHVAIRRGQLQTVVAGLEALSPLAVLSRGYAVVRAPSGSIVRGVHQVKKDDAIRVRLGTGAFTARVVDTDPTEG